MTFTRDTALKPRPLKKFNCIQCNTVVENGYPSQKYCKDCAAGVKYEYRTHKAVTQVCCPECKHNFNVSTVERVRKEVA